MMKRRLLQMLATGLLLAFCLSTNSLQARHIIGGYLSYECLGIDQFNGLVTLKLKLDMVRERSGGGAGFESPIDIGIYQQDANGNWVSFAEESLNLETVEALPLNLDPYQFLPSLMDYEIAHYERNINLPQQGPFLLAFQRCCRLDREYRNVISSDSLGAAMTLMITNEGLAVCSSSPQMSFDGNRLFYLDSLTERTFEAQDVDGDQLVMSFVAPKMAGGLAGSQAGNGSTNDCDGVTPSPYNCPPPFEDIPYQPGFDFENPFGLNNASVDPNSLTLSATPTEEGLYLIGLKLQDYRNGQVMSETYYDYVVEVAPEIFVSIIEAQCYHDLNKNGVREVEEPNIAVPLTAVEEVVSINRGFGGGADIYVDQLGTYTLLPFLKPQWRINTPGDSLKVVVDQLRQTYSVEVPIVGVVEDVLADAYITSEPLVCNSEVQFSVDVINYGIETIDGKCYFTVDSLMTVLGANVPYFQGPEENQIVWDFSFLTPGDQFTFLIDVQTPNEEWSTELFEVGLMTEVYPYGTTGVVLSEFESRYESVLLCSYDPNDKLAHPDNNDGWIAPNEEITYTIRFQNTGNFWAKDVVITDTLDANLDLESFEVLSSSHYHRLKVEDRAVAFQFFDIYLPDSTNNPIESQGYVTYKIRPKSGLEHNTLIENKAYIYFDRNAPIITNTVERKIKIEETEELFFSIFPNPFSNEVFIQLEAPPSDELLLEIYNAQGMKVGTQTLIDARSPVAMDRVGTGLYYLRIMDQNGEVVGSGATIKYQ